MSYDVVIPSAGRESLRGLLEALGPGQGRVLVVDDRRERSSPLAVPAGVEVLAGPGRGPAAARNAGWRAAGAEWVAFLDDDVLPPPGWRAALARDLAAAGPGVGAVQGRVRVPRPARPTDWERNVAGLERARWATADMAYRRDALAAVGGFDERFPRAYREDADLGLRVTAAGWEIDPGERWVLHPVRPAPARAALARQAGNADDVLMRALHGRGWRERAGVTRGRRPRHLAVVAATVAALAARRPRLAAAVWLAGAGELAWARIAPGPRTPREVADMAWTSALMPFAAAAWWLRGLFSLPAALRDFERAPRPRPAAVLFDRDGTLIADVPYNGDPDRVEPLAGACEALERLRAAGVAVGMVSNQSGIGRGLLAHDDVRAVNRRVEELLGPLDVVEYCPHAPDDGCSCRKPAPGMVLAAAARLGVDPRRCVVVGDIGADVDAGRAAGARGVLVPNERTRPEEVAAARERAASLTEAVDLLLGAPAALPADPARPPSAAAARPASAATAPPASAATARPASAAARRAVA
ncbi:MAG TPA: HAD-IIIA family hydrolase [Solirubrobacteraceae bacterium]|jgi:HAD superfamily hydrolase (TIGR01662 family)